MEYRIEKIDFEVRFVGKRQRVKIPVHLKRFPHCGVKPIKMASCKH